MPHGLGELGLEVAGGELLRALAVHDLLLEQLALRLEELPVLLEHLLLGLERRLLVAVLLHQLLARAPLPRDQQHLVVKLQVAVEDVGERLVVLRLFRSRTQSGKINRIVRSQPERTHHVMETCNNTFVCINSHS